LRCRIKEVAKRCVGSAVGSAKVCQRTLGDHEICCQGHAEVRSSIANDNAREGGWAPAMRTLAIRGPDPAVSALVRESKAPTVLASPNQFVGEEGNVEILISQCRADNAIKTIGNDLRVRATAAAKAHERVEALIDTDRINLFV